MAERRRQLYGHVHPLRPCSHTLAFTVIITPDLVSVSASPLSAVDVPKPGKEGVGGSVGGQLGRRADRMLSITQPFQQLIAERTSRAHTMQLASKQASKQAASKQASKQAYDRESKKQERRSPSRIRQCARIHSCADTYVYA